MKLIAFYLPQYHIIPENEQFWGKGFTEWVNVKKTFPLFPTHQQPRLPTELGYYDLTHNSVRHKQAALAKTYGIDAWCYYYYRFNGKRLLEMPLNKHIEDKSLDMPFLICWANENWTRNWDGISGSQHTLIQQTHNEQDDLEFIKESSAMFMDNRYVRVGNKPLLLLYRTELWPNIQNTVNMWRDYMWKNFKTELFILRSASFRPDINPITEGIDGSYQFPPFALAHTIRRVPKSENGCLTFYKDWPNLLNQQASWKLFRGVLVNFDNTARRLKNFNDPDITEEEINFCPARNPGICYGADPDSYQRWLEAAIKFTQQNFWKEEQLIFLNAWNEWAEGAILEPCNLWGRQYLEATFEARKNLKV